MGVMEGFTRQETLALTENTSNRLQYLERAELVVPQRYGNSKKPTVIYTWEQVLEIRAIKNLRQEVSLQTVRKIITLLNKSGFDNSLRDKKIVVLDDDVYWVMPDWSDMPGVMKVANKGDRELGQFMLIVLPPLASVLEKVWQSAQNSEVIDFESFQQRAKAQPLLSA